MTMRRQKPLAVIVVHADGSQPVNLNGFDRVFPSPGIQLAVAAGPPVLIKSRAISTVHTENAMFGSLVLGAFIGQTASPQITLNDGVFTLKDTQAITQVRVQAVPRTLNTVDGRWWLEVGPRVFTFDENGLGIRQGKYRSYTRLNAIATTPKLFSQDQIDEINREVADEKRSLDVAALSGFEVMNDRLYVLLRWETSEKVPWLEAIVQFDLNAKTPQAQLVGRFEGLTTAKGRVDDRLGQYRGSLVAMTQIPEGLGVATYDLAQSKPAYSLVAPRVLDAKVIDNSTYAFTVTRTRQASFQIGLIDITRSTYRRAFEFRGSIVGVERPTLLRISRNGNHSVVNLESGAEMPVPKTAAIRGTAQGVLLWTPAESPKNAQLYSLSSFSLLSGWADQAGTTAPPPSELR